MLYVRDQPVAILLSPSGRVAGQHLPVATEGDGEPSSRPSGFPREKEPRREERTWGEKAALSVRPVLGDAVISRCVLYSSMYEMLGICRR